MQNLCVVFKPSFGLEIWREYFLNGMSYYINDSAASVGILGVLNAAPAIDRETRQDLLKTTKKQ
jgi:hypothetical protein